MKLWPFFKVSRELAELAVTLPRSWNQRLNSNSRYIAFPNRPFDFEEVCYTLSEQVLLSCNFVHQQSEDRGVTRILIADKDRRFAPKIRKRFIDSLRFIDGSEGLDKFLYLLSQEFYICVRENHGAGSGHDYFFKKDGGLYLERTKKAPRLPPMDKK